MIFFLILTAAMFVATLAQHFIGPLPMADARLLLSHVILFYGALALPVPGMLALAFIGGLMYDALHTQYVPQTMSEGFAESSPEIALGWSIVLFAVLGGLMGGFRPLFLRGRWEIHVLLSGLCVMLALLAEFVMLTLRREPVVFFFNREIGLRIAGSGLVAAIISPFVFLGLNAVARAAGYEPQPHRNRPR